MLYSTSKPDGEMLEHLKAEYLRVYGRLPRIGRSGSWFVIDYTAVRATELQEMVKALRAHDGANGAF